MIYTAQYKYPGNDRIDITVKSSIGNWRVFAQTWDMVLNYKKNKDKKEYKRIYRHILKLALATHKDFILDIIEKAKAEDFTFVCFCKPNEFCHRVLLAKWLERKFGIKYAGER